MDIKNAKDLEKLIKMLRKNGVESFEYLGLSLKLTDVPEKPARKRASKSQDDDVKSDKRYSDEDVLMWSVNNYVEAM